MKRFPVLLMSLAVSLIALPGASAEPSEEANFLGGSRQLVYEGKRSGEGYFSEDGRYLVFQSERDPSNPFYQMYVLDFETGDTHRLSPGTGKTTCGFFRAGTDDVLFSSTHLDPEAVAKQKAELDFRASGKSRRYSWDYDESMDIFTANRDGSNIRRLTDSRGYDAEAAYSPDGSKIVYCSLTDAYDRELSSAEKKLLEIDPSFFGEIWIMNADGSGKRRLTDWEGYDGGPFFSPDGKQIVWRHIEEGGMLADVYTMNLDGSGRRQITDFESLSWAPYFHPSGEYIIFTSNKLGFENFEMFIVDAMGEREPVRVSYTDGFDGLPVFSPDGRKLSWTSGRGDVKKGQIFLANWNHEHALETLGKAPVRVVGGSASSNPGSIGSSRDRLISHVSYLASDELEGRMTGSNGARLAGDYIADHFEKIGLEPAGEDGGYFRSFPFTSGLEVVGDDCAMTVDAESDEPIRLDLDEDFAPLAFTATGECSGEVVFAGYGLVVPGDLGEGYDSYSGLDVTDKIVLVLRYTPEEVDVERKQQLNVYAGLRRKAMLARERGAKGLLVVTGPSSPNAGELIPLRFDRSLSDSGILAASISGEIAERLLGAAGKSLADVQAELDLENPHFEGSFAIPGVAVSLSTNVKRMKSTCRNVVAWLPPGEGMPDEEFVMLGAHYDHIGYGETGSLAGKDEEGQIHNGADDNASGTAVVLEIAEQLAGARAANPNDFPRGVAFALWSGEEIGILGSSHFVENPPRTLDDAAAYFNFDMVGRLRENKLVLQGVGSSSGWKRLIEKKNVAAGFDLKIQEDPYLPTDATSFYNKKVPIVSFFTGSHEEYNRPVDDAETLEYEGMERIAGFAETMVAEVVRAEERPDYVEVERSVQTTGERASLRAYLGTIPDYAQEDVEGVKLSGVSGGGPADKAGVLGGDVIIEFGGQTITNIYDYTYALDAVKIGEPVGMKVLRDGEEISLTITPGARK